MKTAYLFPGQGAQFVGMGRDLYNEYPEVRDLYDRANGILGYDLRSICFDGPEEHLRETRNTQPAIFLHSMAVVRALDFAPGGVDVRAAGHSLGEYSAYAAAGAVAFEDALRLVRRRGELMYQAGVDSPGTMAAILGMDGAAVEGILGGIAGVVQAANLNSPGQVVISGEAAAVELAMQALRDAGAKRVIPLEVSGAFHSPLMEGAAAGLAEILAGTEFLVPRCAVIANASAGAVIEPAEIRASLERQLLAPVRWEQTVRNLLEWGAERFVELGPGKVLTGLVRAVDRSATLVAVGDVAQVREFLAGEGGGS